MAKSWKIAIPVVKRRLLVYAPNSVVVYLLPDNESNRVVCLYHHAEPDPMASNIAARYIISEG